MKAPKEIFVNFKQKVFTADERFAKGYYDRPYTKYLSEESVIEMLSEKDKQIDRLKNEIPQWISAEIEPHCYESGNWDGKRSDWHLVETKEGFSVGRCYSGFMDGSSFCVWYSDNDYEIQVIRYKKINHL